MVDVGWMVAQGSGALAARFGGRHRTDPSDPFAVEGTLPWMPDLARRAPAATEEVLGFLEGGPVVPSSADLSSLSVGVDGAWRLVPLVHRRCDPHVLDLLPVTAGLLHGIPKLRAADIAVLDARSRIAPHRGDNWGVVRVHLTLREPPGIEPCVLRFPELGRERTWRQGDVFAFDDLGLHEAINQRSSERIVLLLEVDRPLPPVSAAINAMAQRLYSWHPVQRAVRFDAIADLVASARAPQTGGARLRSDTTVVAGKDASRNG